MIEKMKSKHAPRKKADTTRRDRDFNRKTKQINFQQEEEVSDENSN